MTNKDWLSNIIAKTVEDSINAILKDPETGWPEATHNAIVAEQSILAKLDEAIPKKQLITLLEGMEDTKYMEGWKAGSNDAIEQIREALLK